MAKTTATIAALPLNSARFVVFAEGMLKSNKSTLSKSVDLLLFNVTFLIFVESGTYTAKISSNSKIIRHLIIKTKIV